MKFGDQSGQTEVKDTLLIHVTVGFKLLSCHNGLPDSRQRLRK